MNNYRFEEVINQFLKTRLYRDYAPNGLQVEGKTEIKRVVTGVTACQLLLDKAVEYEADAILVHHGYFWRNEVETITGIKYKRIKTLLDHNINLLSYHLPLDGHDIVGNNALLGKMLNINIDEREDKTNLLFTGVLSNPLTGFELLELIKKEINPNVLSCHDNAPELVKKIAWCSGAAQDYIEQAALQGFDAFLTGEVSERTIHLAREYGIHFYAAGHHATERCGIKALGEWLAKSYDLEVIFIDINNPV